MGEQEQERQPTEPEIVEPEANVIAGEDEVPRQPAPPLDPYTPDPVASNPTEERAWGVMRVAWIPILVAVAVVIFAWLR